MGQPENGFAQFCRKHVFFLGICCYNPPLSNLFSINIIGGYPPQGARHMKRVFLFAATIAAMMLQLGAVLAFLGWSSGVNTLSSLFYFALLAVASALISVLLSKTLAQNSVGAQVVGEAKNDTEIWLLQCVRDLSQQWDLQPPKVALYHSPELNAFAAGSSRNRALIAVSTGLLENMSRDEVEAVLAHEVAHIGNGDMLTLALMQGVVNTVVVFPAHAVSRMAAKLGAGQRLVGGVYFAAYLGFQFFFGFFASVIVYRFSRVREYRADVGAARLVGVPKMICALQRLRGRGGCLRQDITTMGISGESDAKHAQTWLSSHPSLDKRIERLRIL